MGKLNKPLNIDLVEPPVLLLLNDVKEDEAQLAQPYWNLNKEKLT